MSVLGTGLFLSVMSGFLPVLACGGLSFLCKAECPLFLPSHQWARAAATPGCSEGFVHVNCFHQAIF